MIYLKKMIAPTVVTVLIAVYLVGYFGLLIRLLNILWLKIVLAVVPIAFFGVLIHVFVQRIKEIRSGEEDDLSQY